MIVNCPSCKARYDLSGRGPIPDSVRLRCTACSTVFVVRKKPAAPAPTAAGARPAAPAKPAPSLTLPVVLVAHDSAEVRKLLIDIISAEKSMKVLEAPNGDSALQILRSQPVQVMISDVALQGLLGFELAERLKKDDILGTPKVILMASIYNHARYKRSPTQLYGCDDYLEKHHVHDMLVPKINKLIYNLNRQDSSRTPPAETGTADTGSTMISEKAPEAHLSRSQEDILKKPELDDFRGKSSPAAHENAQRLARIIVSDIALYSQELLAEGLRTNKMDEFLKKQFDDAREMYKQRVPEAVRKSSDYLEQAIREYITSFTKQQTS